ncbi:MAG: hypothetical protein ACM3SY_15830 [Candidatus Omnitrophota bacterium]
METLPFQPIRSTLYTMNELSFKTSSEKNSRPISCSRIRSMKPVNLF